MAEAAAPRHGVRGLPLTFVGGIVAVVAYLGCTLVSYLRFPGPFGPLDNWLSDLGNAELNPSGALVYNVGVTLTGVALLAFFGGLQRWSRQAEPRTRRRIQAVQVIGYVAAITTVGTALIRENVNMDVHGIVSMTNIEFLAAAAAFVRTVPLPPAWVLACDRRRCRGGRARGTRVRVRAPHVLDGVARRRPGPPLRLAHGAQRPEGSGFCLGRPGCAPRWRVGELGQDWLPEVSPWEVTEPDLGTRRSPWSTDGLGPRPPG